MIRPSRRRTLSIAFAAMLAAAPVPVGPGATHGDVYRPAIPASGEVTRLRTDVKLFLTDCADCAVAAPAPRVRSTLVLDICIVMLSALWLTLMVLRIQRRGAAPHDLLAEFRVELGTNLSGALKNAVPQHAAGGR